MSIMETQQLIELFQQELRRIKCDARAETLFALAMDQGLSPEDVLIGFDKLFYREYSRDILSTETKEDGARRMLLQVHLTRGGIYDLLPEGLFFQPSESGRHQPTSDMVLDYRANQRKEEHIRRFFVPLENDFFWQRIRIEQEESRMLEGLQAGMLNDYFVKFWGIPESIPRECVAPLLILLPHAYKIAGNLFLTGQCLQQLLQEEAIVRQITAGPSGLPAGQAVPLGESRLGVDLTSGDEFVEDYPVLECVVGPLIGSRLQDYLEGGRRHTLMETFCQFFIPAGADVKLTIVLAEERQHMVLRRGEEPLLGYSSVL
jgi:hypothetical protein